MKILTLNTWKERGPWRERWEIIFQGLKAFQPDVVIFQEIFNPEWVKEITRRTGYAGSVYREPESGLAIFSRFKLLEADSKPLAAQSTREEYRRFGLFGRFKSPAGEFCVFDTHLSWMLEDGEVREEQTQELAAWMDQKAGTREAVIGGDFNATAWTLEIRCLTEGKKFSDVFARVHPKSPGLTWTYDNFYTREGRHPLPDRRIDYLFTRHAGPLLSQPITASCIFAEPDERGVFASDHFGVLAEFNNL